MTPSIPLAAALLALTAAGCAAPPVPHHPAVPPVVTSPVPPATPSQALPASQQAFVTAYRAGLARQHMQNLGTDAGIARAGLAVCGVLKTGATPPGLARQYHDALLIRLSARYLCPGWRAAFLRWLRSQG